MKKIFNKSHDNRTQEAKSAKKITYAEGKIHGAGRVIVGNSGYDSPFTNKYPIYLAKYALFIILVLFSALVVFYVFIGKNNQDKTVAQPTYEITDQDVRLELNNELKNPLQTNDISKKQAYYNSVLSKLYILGDSTITAELYSKNIQQLNITFDIETQEWIINSLIVNGYNDSAKKAISNTLPMLYNDLQKVEERYKPEIIAKIDRYKSLEARL